MEKTCGNCPYLRFDPSNKWSAANCGKNEGEDPIIPHHSNSVTKKLIFWRVPEWCERTEGVLKSENQAPEKDWVHKDFSDFE